MKPDSIFNIRSFSKLLSRLSSGSSPRKRAGSQSRTLQSLEALESRQLLTLGLVDAGSFVASASSGLASDAIGNRYMTGFFTGAIDADPAPTDANLVSNGGFDVYISRFSPDGTLAWSKSFGGAFADQSADIAVDAAGNSFVTGFFDGVVDFDPSAAAFNMDSADGRSFIVKLNVAGDFVWARQFGGAVAPAYYLATDVDGSVVIAGEFSGTADFDPASTSTYELSTAAMATSGFLLKLNSAGSFQWANATGGIGAVVSMGSLDVANDGSVAFVGSTVGGLVDFDPGRGSALGLSAAQGTFVTRLNPNGTFQWSRQITTEGLEGFSAASFDSVGNLNLGGFFSGTVDFDPGRGVQNRTAIGAGNLDAMILQLTPGGGFSWIVQVNSEYNTANISDLYVDADNAVIFGGVSSGTTRLTTGSADVILTEGNGGFIGKISRNGTPVTGSRLIGYTIISDLAAGPAGDVLAAGIFHSTIDLDPGAGEFLLSTPAPNIFHVFESRFTQELRTSSLAAGTNEFLLRRNEDNVELYDKTSGALLRSTPLDALTGIEINGKAGSRDTLVVDYGQGGFALPKGIRFNGDTGSDGLTIIGQGNESVRYRTGLVPGSAEFQMNGGNVLATGIEASDISQLANVRFETQSMLDVLTVAPIQVNNITLKSEIYGTGGGQAIVPLAFFAVEGVTLDTGTADLIAAQSADSVTISIGALDAPGLRNFSVATGIANDTLTLVGPDFGAPGEVGVFSFNGGVGLDRIAVTGNVDWTLSNTQLQNNLGSRLALASVEAATIVGGSSDNVISAVSFSGSTLLRGSSGNDMIRGGAGNDIIYGFTGNDRLHGNGGNDQLYGEDGDDFGYGGEGDDSIYGGNHNDRLFGGDGNDLIQGFNGNDVIRGEDGTDTILGEVGNDSINGGDDNDNINGGDGNDNLNGGEGDDIVVGGIGNDRLNGGDGDDSLQGDAGVDLYIFDGTIASEAMALTRNSATTATYTRKPRGLVSLLELDTIVNDASDEFLLNALAGDDLIAIDAAFTLLGTVDGGDGTDTCTGPVAWSKISC